MSKVSENDVRYLAQLSNLQLSDTEVNDLQVDLGNILNYIEQLGELDTTGVEPTYQVTGLSNVGRSDEVEPHHVGREALLKLAPDHHDNQVKVPKVL